MVTKDVELRLQKIRWNWRIDKLPSLHKVMKYNTSKDVIDRVSKYIEIEHTVWSAMHEHQLSGDFLCLCINDNVMKVQKDLLEELISTKVKGSDAYLSFDYTCLQIILCYLLQKYNFVIELMSELILSCAMCQGNFDAYPNYKIKLFSEAVLYYFVSSIKTNNTVPSYLLNVPIIAFKYLAEQQEKISIIKKDCNAQVLPLLIELLTFSIKLACLTYIHCIESPKDETGKIIEIIGSAYNSSLSKVYAKCCYIPCIEIAVHTMLYFWSEKLDFSPAFTRDLSSTQKSTLNSKINSENNLRSTRMEYLVSCVLILIDNMGHTVSVGKDSVFLSNKVNYYSSLAIIMYTYGLVDMSLSNTLITTLRCSRDNPFILMEMGMLFMREGMFILSRNCFNFAMEHKEVSKLCRLFLTQAFLNDLCDLELAEEELNVLLATSDTSFPIKINSYLAFGISKIKEGINAISALKKEKLLIEALEMLKKGSELDSENGEIIFAIALCQALLGNCKDALIGAHRALILLPEDSRSVHLLVLLLSSKGKYSKGLEILDEALKIFQNDLNLYYLKIILLSYLNKYEEIMSTCEIALNICYEFSRLSVQFMRMSRISDLDFSLEGIAETSKIEIRVNTMDSQDGCKEVMKEINNENQESSHSHFLYYHEEMRRKFFLISIELLSDKYPEYCKTQLGIMRTIDENHPDYIYAKEFCRLKNFIDLEMSDEFASNLVFHPDHLRSLYLHFDYLCNKSKNSDSEGHLAIKMEHCATRLVQMDSLNSYSWMCLGKAFVQLKSPSDAANSFEKSISLRKKQPVLPFDTIPISFMSHCNGW